MWTIYINLDEANKKLCYIHYSKKFQEEKKYK